jgi:hypothetical protein
MATTDLGLYYPGKGELVSPLEAQLALMQSSVDAEMQSQLTPVAVNSEAEITALPKGTIFYWTNWELTGFKIRDAGVVGHRMIQTGIVVASPSQNHLSGGGLNPGAATIPISDQSFNYPTTQYKVKYEATVMLSLIGTTAGFIWLDLGGGLKREMRYHNYGRTGLYPVTTSIERSMPAGPCQGVMTGNSDVGSSDAAIVLTVSSSLTISV